MLIIKRTRGESVHIFLSKNLPPDMTVSELFKDGGIEIHMLKTKCIDASIGIKAPGSLLILREELLPQEPDSESNLEIFKNERYY